MTWASRDWRQLLALLFLGGGGVSITGLAAYALQLTAERSPGPWPIAYFAYGCLGLIGVVLTSFGYVLGRHFWKFSAGPVSAQTSGGDQTPLNLDASMQVADQ